MVPTMGRYPYLAPAVYVEFNTYLHDYYLKHGRMPDYNELSYLGQKVWQKTVRTAPTRSSYERWYDTGSRARKTFYNEGIMGLALECAIHKFLVEEKCHVEYNAHMDVYMAIDLMVEFKPVQIKSDSTFMGKEGIFYLFIGDFNGALTSVHKKKIREFVQYLKHS